MLLAAVLSDTVIFNSPTTTERDREVVRYLEGLLDLDAREFGMEMFEASSDVSGLSAQENGYLFATLMITDIVDRGTKLLCAGDCASVEWAFDSPASGGVIDLPGVMSRKKQVAPRLLEAF